MDSATIEEANREVTVKLTDEQLAIIGRYAAEHGTVNAIRDFKRYFPKDSCFTL